MINETITFWYTLHTLHPQHKVVNSEEGGGYLWDSYPKSKFSMRSFIGEVVLSGLKSVSPLPFPTSILEQYQISGKKLSFARMCKSSKIVSIWKQEKSHSYPKRSKDMYLQHIQFDGVNYQYGVICKTFV